MKILFVSWDGPQVTYMEGLFLPIFAALKAHGIEFHVLQFTWASRRAISRTCAAYEAAGATYQSVRVWRCPKALGAVVTALWGARQIARSIRRLGIDAVMPRSIMPAFATMVARGIGKTPLIFDADGLPIDERVEFGRVTAGSLRHRTLRAIEVEAVRRAAVVLTRTARAVDVLQARAGAGTGAEKFHVVGNGRDPRVFHPSDECARSRVRSRLGIAPTAPLLVYAGSLGEQYCPAHMLRLFNCVLRRRPDARLLVLSKAGHDMMKLAVQMSIPAQAITLIALQPEEVPEHLACADLGLGLRAPSFSMQGVAPIKLGEYLLCGVPVIVSTVIANAHLVDSGTGVCLEVIDRQSLERAADWLVDQVLSDREGFRERCAALGLAAFSLDQSVNDYVNALRVLHAAPDAPVEANKQLPLLDPRVIG